MRSVVYIAWNSENGANGRSVEESWGEPGETPFSHYASKSVINAQLTSSSNIVETSLIKGSWHTEPGSVPEGE